MAHCHSPKTICDAISKNWWNKCKETDIRLGAQIREIIFMRDSFDTQFLSESECQLLIVHLSTLPDL